MISKRSKKKAEEEDSLNDIPESTLIQTSEKILNSGDEIDINALNENYSLKDSERKKIISDYYSKHLSEIIPDFLYLSSYNAAKNKDLLEKRRGLGMFVKKGAQQKIMEQRKESFYNDYVKSLLVEAGKLGITKQHLLDLIERGENDGSINS